MVNLAFKISWRSPKGNALDSASPFGDLRRRLSDWKPAFTEIARNLLAKFLRRQFETRGAEGGARWAELAPSTLMKRRGAGATPLIRTGRLLASLIGEDSSHVNLADKRTLRWGTLVTYAGFHQTGTGKGFGIAGALPTGRGTGRGMPMRKMIVITEGLQLELRDVFAGRLLEVGHQAGFLTSGE